METNKTPFSVIYDSFLNRVTDNMYMELTEVDTYAMLQTLLINGISAFEFPRFNIYDYELGYLDEGGMYEGIDSDYRETYSVIWVGGHFNTKLTQEEINIVALNMVVEWLGQQLATVENTRLKYSGADFKFSSQANHMAKLKTLIDSYKQESKHLQRLYKRRRFVDGEVQSTLDSLV